MKTYTVQPSASSVRWSIRALVIGVCAISILTSTRPVVAESLGGRVVDKALEEAEREGVANARLTLIGLGDDSRLMAISGSNGRFLFPQIADGNYRLEVWREGFRPIVKELEVEGQMWIEVRLVAGAAEPPAGHALEPRARADLAGYRFLSLSAPDFLLQLVFELDERGQRQVTASLAESLGAVGDIDLERRLGEDQVEELLEILRASRPLELEHRGRAKGELTLLEVAQADRVGMLVVNGNPAFENDRGRALLEHLDQLRKTLRSGDSGPTPSR